MTTSLRAVALLLSVLLSACGGGGNKGAAAPASGSTSSTGSTGAGTNAGTTTGSGTSTAAGSTAPTPSATDVLTYHNDTLRTGQNLSESVLTPSNVTSATFGKLRILAADGKVDAAPLIVSGLSINGVTHNVVYVASEHDSVYTYDADSGAALAQVSLLASGETPSDARNCGQVIPEIGITSTPVIDRSAGPNGTLYVVAMSKDASGTYHQRLHALDLVTLADRVTAQDIHATAAGNGPNTSGGQLTFDSKQYKERSALLLVNTEVYVTFASHCDITPYNGWIMAYSEATLAQTRVLPITPNGAEGAIWDTGGMSADSSGNIFATVGNGTFDTTLTSEGLPSQQDYGNTALKMSTSGAALVPTDYFTPSNTVSASANDVDFGSGSVLLLIDQADATGTMRHLIIAGGKDGNMYVLDRDNMGHFSAAGNNAYEVVPVGGELFSSPIYFNGSVYVGDVAGTLKAYAMTNARLSATPTSQSANTFAYPGTSPALSALAGANAILWAVESAVGTPAVLHAYNPANLGQEYYNSSQAAAGRDSFGNGNKFITPVIANGKVFVGTPSGVAVFGLL